MNDYADPPEVLHQRDIWLVWKYDEREKSDGSTYLTKVPLDPETGAEGDATDEAITTSFEEAVEAHERLSQTDGVGFAFLEDDLLVGTDLDDVRDPETGKLNKLGRGVMTTLDSYTEVSPSGTGLHVVTLALKPGDRCKRKLSPDGDRDGDECEIEMYDSDRFFTYTGERVDGVGFGEVEQRKNEIAEVYETYLASESSESDGGEWNGETPDLDLDDEQVLEKARGASNGDKFERLEKGDDSMHGGDTSRADQAFVNYLAFYTGGDRQQIDRLFRASGRMRPKWDPDNHSAYQQHTIDTALSGRTEFYEPGKGGNGGPDVTAASEAVANAEDAETDGGVAAESGSESGPGPSPIDSRSIRERIVGRVLRPYDADEDSIDVQTAINRVADEFCDEWHFVYPEREVPGWREALHVYNPSTGVYEPRGEAFVRRQAEDLLNAFATNTRVNEIVEKISRRNLERGPAFDVSPERLVVGNGILDLHTGELDDYTPEEYHATRIGVDYRPEAECPGIDQFFHEVVKDDDVGTLYRVAAHTLYKDYIGSKTVMLVGGGANGKTMYTWLLEQLLNPSDTEKNTTGISLGEISDSNNNFAVSDLYGKLANINADINSSDVNDLGPLKRLTGGDLMDADVKYESRVRFRNYASLIFAVNQMPSFSEDTHALWRRWVYLKFPYTFEPNDPETDPEHVVKDRIGSESELEGLLAQCVEEIQEWHNGREMYPDIPGPEQIREMMLRAAEPVYDFAKTCLREDEDGQLRTEEVRSAFRDYARETGLGSAAAMDPGRFGEKLQSVAEFPIENKQVRQKGSRVRCYTGVEWTSRGEQIANGEAPKEIDQAGLDPDGIGKSYEPSPDPNDEGPEADAQRVLAVLREDGPLGDGELAAKVAEQFDLSPDETEAGLATLLRDGRAMDDEGGYRAT